MHESSKKIKRNLLNLMIRDAIHYQRMKKSLNLQNVGEERVYVVDDEIFVVTKLEIDDLKRRNII